MLSRGLRCSLAGSLLASAWVAVQSDDTSSAVVPPRPRPPARGVAAPGPALAWPVPLRRDTRAWPPAPAQALAAWGPAPAPPSPPPLSPLVVAAAPPPPQAPPFPYTLIGRVQDGSEMQAVLSGPLRTLGVKRADVIDAQWRVEDIRADGLTLTWLPGGLRQTLGYRPS